MGVELPKSDNHSGLDRIPDSIPLKEVLSMFNAELRHHIASMSGCAQILSMNPPEDLRLRVLNILSGNLDRVEKLQAAVKIYLGEPADET